MHQDRWDGTSVLYVTPIRALLNNLEPRIKEYAGWLGRTVGFRHGDTTAGQRARLLRERPDVLLTTPESLEAMLGEKRLVFCESRRQVEGLATALRERSVETFLSHSSLSLEERRLAETAFAYSRDCVIVSTSTLELGIDVGDLDRVIQLGATRSVASMLQRLGRTGRRPGTSRNMLFLGVESEDYLRAAAVLLLWGRDTSSRWCRRPRRCMCWRSSAGNGAAGRRHRE